MAVKCTAGSMVSAAADVCELCPVGALQASTRDEPRQTSCDTCAAGHSCAQGAAQMMLCAKGSFTNASILKDVCEPCAAGEFQARVASWSRWTVTRA